jgi:hypothetical protein
MSAGIKERAVERAEAISDYRKKMAQVIVGMRNGKIYEVDGVETIKEPPVSIVVKLAQGVCWEEKLRMEKADAMYKSVISNIESMKAQLNGYQSIFRHLDRS